MLKKAVFARTWKSLALFLLFTALYLMASSSKPRLPQLPDILTDLLLVLTIMMGLHVLERAVLWEEIAEWHTRTVSEMQQASVETMRESNLGLTKAVTASHQLLSAAAQSGLAHIYQDRYPSTSDVIAAIRGARERVWLLGTTLTEGVDLQRIAETLRNKLANKVQVRLLLLDPYRSPAVFRCLLESLSDDVAEILGVTGSGPRIDVLFKQRIYGDSDRITALLTRTPAFQDAVRFYAHNPNCWMAVADNVAFFEPYTFGRKPSQVAQDLCLGPHMPVLKWEKHTGDAAFELLVDHFDKLWLTSDVDFFHFSARDADRTRIVTELFERRLAWLRQVHGALTASHLYNQDRRAHPRQVCDLSLPPLLVEWQEQNTVRQSQAHVIDCSATGILLDLTQPERPNIGTIVRLKQSPEPAIIETTAKIRNLLRRATGGFSVCRHTNSRIALKANEQRGQPAVRTVTAS